MAIPIINNWQSYFFHQDEGLGSSYERVILNQKLLQIISLFQIDSVLEAPCFGFTGISGINSMELAKNGKKVTLIEHDSERKKCIKQIWDSVTSSATIELVKEYEKLPLQDKSVDLSWNFSAMWFVQDLNRFLEELARVTNKVIFICVPNRFGIGYLSQKLNSEEPIKNEAFIIPKNVKKIMRSLGWQLLQGDFIDSPPWPDIGMPKEEFLAKFGLKKCFDKSTKTPLSILPYYQGNDETFPEKMLHYFWFEKKLPGFIKRIWAHHQYMLFIHKHEQA